MGKRKNLSLMGPEKKRVFGGEEGSLGTLSISGPHHKKGVGKVFWGHTFFDIGRGFKKISVARVF